MSNTHSVGNSGFAAAFKPHSHRSDSMADRSDDQGQGDNSGKHAFKQWLQQASDSNTAANPLSPPPVTSNTANFSPIAAMAPVPLRDETALASQIKPAAKKRQRR